MSRDVGQFAAKVQELAAVLDPPYRGDHRLIHGDFFPGNLLVDDTYAITALLDFGLLTMYGDPHGGAVARSVRCQIAHERGQAWRSRGREIM